MKVRFFALAAFALLLLKPAPAHAMVFTLDDTVTGVPGDVLTLFGTLTTTVTDPDPLYINGDSLSFTGPVQVTIDDTPFFTNVPAFLSFSGGPSTTGLVAMLSVNIGLGALPGTYSGQLTVQGGATPGDANDLGTQDFTVTVRDAVTPAVPEPASMLLLGTGLAMIVRRRRK